MNGKKVVLFVGNGFIRSETSDNYHGLLNGISYAFWVHFPIHPTGLKREGFGMHKCIPYESSILFQFNAPAHNRSLAERIYAFRPGGGFAAVG